MSKIRKRGKLTLLSLLIIAISLCLTGCSSKDETASSAGVTEQAVQTENAANEAAQVESASEPAAGEAQPQQAVSSSQDAAPANPSTVDLASLPSYTGSPYIIINDNVPNFSPSELVAQSFEEYAPLDSLGRVGVAYSCVGTDLMPKEERGSISEIKPTGWVQESYDFIDGGKIYNRCHLIAHQLTAENANDRNLMTGTRYLNTEGMLPFEEEIGDYIRETGNHVLYRVTPVFNGNDLLAHGVQLEAQSIEDGGEGVKFNVYCYNVEPGVAIDYATGENHLDESQPVAEEPSTVAEEPSAAVEEPPAEAEESITEKEYVLNTNSMKFHEPSCDSVSDISEKNRQDVTSTREEIINSGYTPCKRCNP